MHPVLEFLLLFVVAFGVFIVVDLVWLVVIARKLYKKYLGYIMTDKVRWGAALIFYVIFIAGLVFFAIMPANNALMAMLYGGLLGFLGYATYDLTNLATLKGWPVAVTIIDLIWGTSLGAIVSVLTFLIVR
ncbi:MAG: DUF2177 family protein [Bacilli bacterium]